MRGSSKTFRRLAGLSAAVVAVLAMAMPSATATGVSKVHSHAASQALKVSLTLPSSAQLKAVLKSAGVEADALPASEAITVEQVISWNNADMNKISGAKGFATALATSANLAGVQKLDRNDSVSSSCNASSCDSANSIAALRATLLDQVVEGGIGTVELAGAESASKSKDETLNRTALARININLAKLIGAGGPLAAVGDALGTLTDSVNNAVLPTVNPALKNAEDTLASNLPAAIKKELDEIITLGTINPIPDLRSVDLLDLTVLAGRADITKSTVAGSKVIQAISESKVTDISILGDWAKIGSVVATAKAQGPLEGIDADFGEIRLDKRTNAPVSSADAKRLAAVNAATAKLKSFRSLLQATPSMKIENMNIGGLLGVHVSDSYLVSLSGLSRLEKVLGESIDDGNPAKAQIINAFKLIARTSGVTIEKIPGSVLTKVDPALSGTRSGSNFHAIAQSDMLKIRVEPAIPVGLKDADLSAGVPVLKDDDFVSTGIAIEVTLPSAAASVAQGAVLGVRYARTGVGTPFFAAFLLLGAALIVKRFALSK